MQSTTVILYKQTAKKTFIAICNNNNNNNIIALQYSIKSVWCTEVLYSIKRVY